MAYGAVTRNLVKRVAELEGDIGELNVTMSVLRDIYDEYMRGEMPAEDAWAAIEVLLFDHEQSLQKELST